MHIGFSASNYTDFSVLYEIIQWIWITENYAASMESACALTKNMEVSFSSSSASPKASSKASSSESTASSENCVTVSDTDVSVPPRKKTKLIDQDQLYWPGPVVLNNWMHILFIFLWKYGKFHKNTEDYKYYTEMSNI